MNQPSRPLFIVADFVHNGLNNEQEKLFKISISLPICKSCLPG
jgi:hypothetical protein